MEQVDIVDGSCTSSERVCDGALTLRVDQSVEAAFQFLSDEVEFVDDVQSEGRNCSYGCGLEGFFRMRWIE